MSRVSVSTACAMIVFSTLSSQSIARFGSGCSVRAVLRLRSSPSAAGREHVLNLSVASSVGCGETFFGDRMSVFSPSTHGSDVSVRSSNRVGSSLCGLKRLPRIQGFQ